MSQWGKKVRFNVKREKKRKKTTILNEEKNKVRLDLKCQKSCLYLEFVIGQNICLQQFTCSTFSCLPIKLQTFLSKIS